jgi:hypothetical protein
LSTCALNWSPHTQLDILRSDPHSFRNAEADFYRWQASQIQVPLEQLGLPTYGWVVITQRIAEQLLLRNLKNRKLRFAGLIGYALDIKFKRWKKTGQPIIIGRSGRLLDGAHRLWAVYLTGESIETFVVTDVDDISEPQLFAYMDNVQKRTAADALDTSGNKALSKSIARVIFAFAIPDDEHQLRIEGISDYRHLQRSPVDIMVYLNDHPLLATVVAIMTEAYKPVQNLLYPEVANYLGWRIHEIHGEEVFHAFMNDLQGDISQLPSNNPIKELHRLVELHHKGHMAAKDTRAGLMARQKIMRKEKMLATAITAFNMTILGQTVDPEGFSIPPQAFPQVVTLEEVQAQRQRGA